MDDYSKQILAKLISDRDFIKAKNMLLYYPINNEVDTTPLFETSQKGKNLYLPKILGSIFFASLFDEKKTLTKGKYGIMEPKTTNTITASKLDLIIIPGVAFDENGYRIGYGKGYFDKFLIDCNCPKIGLAYDFQVLKNIPHNDTDVKMTKIITEKRLIQL